MDCFKISHDLQAIDWYALESLFHSVGWHNHTTERLKKAFQNSSYVSLGFFDGQLVACARAISDEEFYTAIYDVVVHPAFQGQGYGKLIVTDVLNHYKDIGFIHLTATTGKDVFYKKLGLKRHKTGMARYLNQELGQEYLE